MSDTRSTLLIDIDYADPVAGLPGQPTQFTVAAGNNKLVKEVGALDFSVLSGFVQCDQNITLRILQGNRPGDESWAHETEVAVTGVALVDDKFPNGTATVLPAIPMVGRRVRVETDNAGAATPNFRLSLIGRQ